jgi:predicted RNase H-like HicB family nuclease
MRGIEIEINLIFEPQKEGGYHVYASGFPGFHTQGEDLDEAMRNAHEAVTLYLES